jgi:hypothetical protein
MKGGGELGARARRMEGENRNMYLKFGKYVRKRQLGEA